MLVVIMKQIDHVKWSLQKTTETCSFFTLVTVEWPLF